MWRGGEGLLAGPALLPDGDLVAVDLASDIGQVGSGIPSLRRLSTSGAEVWRVDVPEGFPPEANPEVAAPAQGGVLIRSATHLVAVSDKGTIQWRAPLPGLTGTPGPIVDRNGDIYIGSGRRVLSFRPDGVLRWDVALSASSAVPLASEELGAGDIQRLIIGADGMLVAVVGRTVVALQ